MISGLVSIDRPCSAVFREDDEVHAGIVAPRLGDQFDDPRGLPRQIGLRDGHGQLQLHEADHDAVRRFVEAPARDTDSCATAILTLVIDSSPGAPFSERFGETEAIMMKSVSR